jgi:hypothetical protein
MEADCRMLCARMREVSLRCCRVDLIVRRAVTDPEMIASGAVEHGITAYLTACGATTDESGVALESALGVFADSLLRDSTVQ